MMKKDVGLFIRVITCLMLVFCVLFIPCCKKSPSESPSGNSPDQATGDTAQPPGQTTAQVPDEVSSTQETVAGTNNADMVPIDIELPRAVFIGTPQDTRVANLEKPLGKARPPFLAPEGTKNVAAGKEVTSSDSEPIIGELSYITDGDKEAADGSYVELGPLLQHVTIDLGGLNKIYAIVVWHHHMQAQVYYDVVVQVADDADFVTNVKTVFNNDIDNSAGFGIGKDMHYTETNEGKLIDAKGVKACYVRLYSNGNTSDELNRYTEVEVYGKPVE
jgi:hypothetical protein